MSLFSPAPILVLKSAMKQPSRPASPQTSPTSTRASLPSPSSSPPLAPLPSPSPLQIPALSIPPSDSPPRISSPLTALGLGLHTPYSSHLTPSSPQIYSSTSAVQSPPLTPGYTPKVSFDTFENQSASMFSFTLQVKTDGYRRTRSTRVFLCAASPDETGREALDWCLEALVQDGDELIVFRGVDEDVLDKDHDLVREEARELMRSIQSKSVEYDTDRKLSLIVEYIPGRITDTIDRLIALYRPDSLVVGTRGKRSRMSMSMSMSLGGMGAGGGGIGSVSKYCLSHSPVPVIVVRPERKVRKVLEKRRADPKRGRHFET